jgi:hypothetical protein
MRLFTAALLLPPLSHPPQLANGSKSVFVPKEPDYSSSDFSVGEGSDTEGGDADRVDGPAGALAAKHEAAGQRSRAAAVGAKAARAALAEHEAEAAAAQDAFSIGTTPQAVPPAVAAEVWAGGASGSGSAGEEAGPPGDSVAVTLLPPGEALSAAAPATFRRSTGTGHLRKRTTSTQEP